MLRRDAAVAPAPVPGIPSVTGVLVPLGLALCAVTIALSVLQTIDGTSPMGLVIVLGAAVGGTAVAYRPAWLVPAFLAFTWSSISTFGVRFAGFTLVDAGVLALLAMVVLRALRGGTPWREPVLLCVLLAAALLGPALMTETTGTALNRARDLAFVVIAALGIRGVAGVQRTVTALTAIGAVLGLGAISSVLIGPSPFFGVVVEQGTGADPDVGRAIGPFGEPNFFALSMAALAPFALLLASRPGPRRLLGLVTIAALAGGVLATGSRGALLALAATTIVWGLAAERGTPRTAAVAGACAIAAMLPVFALQTSGAEKRTTDGRMTEMAVAVEVFQDHPVVGIGPGSYPAYYRDYARRVGNDPRTNREAHSLPLQIAAEQGLAGLLAWMAAIVLVAARARAARLWSDPVGRAICLAPLTYLAGSLFLHGSQLRLPYILAGLVLAAAAVRLEEDRRAAWRPEGWDR